jgi:RNA polymerase sigma-70 factor (ECF subfamily)
MTATDGPRLRPDPPEPARPCSTPWLEPYPDALLEHDAGACPRPGARYRADETMSLAFIAALQLLPPNQRAALVLRDVLGFCAAETAEILESTAGAVDGAVACARTALEQNAAASGAYEPPPAPGSPAERDLMRQLMEAHAAGDVDSVISLLTEDVWVTVRPAPFEYQGREVAARLLGLLIGSGTAYRLVPTRANGQPAFGIYAHDPCSGRLHASGLMVVTLAGDRICSLSCFAGADLARFGLPRTLEA